MLDTGFLEANPDLAKRLNSGDVSLRDYSNELLRLVYRLIFIMVAEDRKLLHPANARSDARKVYQDGYSLTLLREKSSHRTSRDRHYDRFEAI